MINILQITESLDCGGRETFTVVLLNNIDQHSFHFDFFTIRSNDEFYTEYVKKMGCKIFSSHTQKVGSGLLNFLKKNISIYNTIKNNKFDIIHIHADNKLDYIKVLLVYFIARVPIVYHAHGSAPLSSPVKCVVGNIAEKIASSLPKVNLACSSAAAENMYKEGKPYFIIRNPIDIDSYLYNSEFREIIRNRFKIEEDSILIGHVGRFSYEKNHEFILKCFMELLKVKPNSYLLLIGDGPLKKNMQEYCVINKIERHVIFAGSSKCVNQIYSAIDVFWFPSKKESLGMVAVEAQLSGTPVIISKGVPNDVMINKNVYQLECDTHVWNEKTLELKRIKTIEKDKFSQFDARIISEMITNIYYKLAK